MASTTTETAVASVLNIRPLNDRTKQEYQNSFGTFSRTVGPFGRWTLWNVIDTVNQIWSELQIQIVALLEAKASEIHPPRRYRGPKDPSHALRCYMVGLDQAHASPHVAVICGQKWFCTQVRDIVLISGLLQERGWAGFLKLQGEIRQPGGTSPTLHALGQISSDRTSPYESLPKVTYAAKSIDRTLRTNDVAISLPSDRLPRTLCGTRIAVPGVDGLVGIATLGGVVEIDGEAYGLTASHAFMSKSLDYDNSETEADSDSESSNFTFDEDDLDPFVRRLNPTEVPETQGQRPDTPATETSPSQSIKDAPLSLSIEPALSPTESPDQAVFDNPSSHRRHIRDSVIPRACTNCWTASSKVECIIDDNLFPTSWTNAVLQCDGARPACSRCALRRIQASCSYELFVKEEHSSEVVDNEKMLSQEYPGAKAAPVDQLHPDYNYPSQAGYTPPLPDTYSPPPGATGYPPQPREPIRQVSDEEFPPVNIKDQYGAAVKTAPPPSLTRSPPYVPTMSWTLGSLKTFENTSVSNFQWALISIGHKDLRKACGVNDLQPNNMDMRLRITSISDAIVPDGKDFLLLTTRGGVSAVGLSSKSSIKLTSSNGYRSLGTVQLERAEEGDCGSWAVDIRNGDLLGMLVASCDISREAYILPAREIFAEIMRVSGKSVALPSLEAVDTSNQPILMEQRIEYPYKPLRMNEIRILTVSPGKPGTRIECYLSVHNLGEPGEYEALSFAWETWELSSSVELNHQSINVAPSLASALENFRYSNKPRHLWVDAICINQQDAQEMNTQIALMANIMEGATDLCIWLGEEDENTQLAFSSHHRIMRLDDLSRLKSDDSLLRQVVALSTLFARSWFHRRWSLQDVCRAKKATLYCGTYTMAWTTFADVITLLSGYERQSADFSRRLVKSKFRSQRDPSTDLTNLSGLVEVVHNAFRRTENGQILERVFSLETLVSDVLWLNVTVPHDSIYSLLSLAKDAHKPRSSLLSPNLDISKNPSVSPMVLKAVEAFRKPLRNRREVLRIEVDYSKPFADVCKDFVDMAIHDSNSLDMICRPWAPAVVDLPSWVSTVSSASMNLQMDSRVVRINADELVSHRGLGSPIKIYEASGLSHPRFHFDAQRLCVEGFFLDEVYAVQPPALMGNIPPGWVDFLGWTDTSTPPPEKVWRLLVANRKSDGQLPPIYYRLACRQAFEQIKPDRSFNLSQRFQQITPDRGLDISQQLADSTTLVQDFLIRVESVVWGRRLIKTEQHSFVGLAPAETENGDLVAILYGCSVPVILRRVLDPQSKEVVYRLIGECYIEGMMDGQALDIRDAMGTRTETLVIV